MLLTRQDTIDRGVLKHCPCCGGAWPQDAVLRVNLDTNIIYGYGVAIHVPPRHAEICYLLAEAYPHLVRHETLIYRIWTHQEISDHLLTTVICMTRRYLERIGYSIKNEHSVGYRLIRGTRP